MLAEMKFVGLIAAVLAMTTAPSFACEMGMGQHRDRLDTYHENATKCLNGPPGEFRFDIIAENAFVEKINQDRSSAGLHPLAVRQGLLPAARFQSLDMGVNDFFEHRSPDGRQAADRIAAFDRTLLAQSTGENLAMMGPTRCFDSRQQEVSCENVSGIETPSPLVVAEELHQSLMNSPGHRANIMSEKFTHVAVGVARTDTGFYVTQVFAKPVGSLRAPLATRIAPDGFVSVAPRLTNWGFGSFSVMDAEGHKLELRGSRLSATKPGEKSLVVRGINVREETEGNKTYIVREWLDLAGPAFTVDYPTENPRSR